MHAAGRRDLSQRRSIDMSDRRNRIVAELQRDLEASVVFFRSLSEEQLGRQVYQDGAQWTVQEVLAHFITIEQSMQWLFKNILAGGPGSPKDFDVDRFNLTQPQKLAGKSLEDLIAMYQGVRADTVDLVASMSEKDFEREGWHAFHGQDKLERFIRWTYEHARMHTEDMRKVL
jgi:hypothetical protein